MNKEPCPTCGHTIDEGGSWQPSSEMRVIPLDVYDTTGSISRHGDLQMVTTHRYRTERAWTRTWGEKEWRSA